MKRLSLWLLIMLTMLPALASAVTPITTRAGKGNTLTWSEMDGNFTTLRNTIDNNAASAAASILALQNAQAGGTLGYATKAAMDADLAHAAGTLAIVTNDADGTNNTYWIKLGGSGSGSWQKSAMPPTLPLVDARLYASFATAVSAQGSTPCNLVVSTTMSVPASVTVPATIHLWILNGGVLNVATSQVVTINGAFTAGQYTVFTGAGSVVFGPGVLNATSLPTPTLPAIWFGSIAEGADITAPLQAAVNAAVASGIKYVLIPGGNYTATALANHQEVILIGTGATIKGITKKVFDPLKDTAVVRSMNQVPPASLATFAEAIRKKSAKIVYWGDSITNGGGNPLYGTETYMEIMKTRLAAAFPDVTFTHVDRGIGGLDIFNASGAGAPFTSPEDFGPPSYPWATVAGKTWRDYVRDEEPDLLVIAFGMNAPTTLQTSSGLAAMESYLATWTKKPSVVWISNMSPVDKGSYYAQQGRNKALSRATRQYAKKLNHALMDVGRQFYLLRDGEDVVNDTAKAVSGLSPADDWTFTSGTQAGNVFTGSAASCYADKATKIVNVVVSARFDMVDSTVIPTIIVRGGRYTLNVQGNTIVLSRDTYPISSYAVPGGISAAKHVLKLEAFDQTFKYYYDGTLVGTVDNYDSFEEGTISVGYGLGGSGKQIDQVEVIEYTPLKSVPIATDNDLFGVYDGTGDQKYPYGGNGINHPTSLAIHTLYTPEIDNLVDSATVALSNTAYKTTAVLSADFGPVSRLKKLGSITATLSTTDNAYIADVVQYVSGYGAQPASIATFHISMSSGVPVVVKTAESYINGSFVVGTPTVSGRVITFPLSANFSGNIVVIRDVGGLGAAPAVVLE